MREFHFDSDFLLVKLLVKKKNHCCHIFATTEMKTCFFKLLTCDNVIGEDEQFGCQEVLKSRSSTCGKTTCVYQGPCIRHS